MTATEHSQSRPGSAPAAVPATAPGPPVGAAAYNEYKFLVSNADLVRVRNILDALHGGSDPFPEGIVDSLYYDTADRTFLRQCLDGEPWKEKFRIRGYGDGRFVQVHRKTKGLYGVWKQKERIRPLTLVGGRPPAWAEISPLGEASEAFEEIRALASRHGPLDPVLRVRYRRRRYRVADHRVTLDSDIEVFGFSGPSPGTVEHALLSDHVLELKTPDPRPYLPLLGLVRLPQSSFSKFASGLIRLEEGPWQP